MSIERAQPSTALKSMPHITTFSGFLSDQMSPVSAHQLNCQEPINIIPDDLNNSERMVTPQSEFARSEGSVIAGDNHFKTGGGDSLTGNEISQPTDQPTDGFIKLGDIKGFTGDRDPGAGYCTGYCFEAFQPIAEMDSFGGSLNPAFEIGGTSGPGGTSFMTGNIGFPTNNIGGSASPGGDDI